MIKSCLSICNLFSKKSRLDAESALEQHAKLKHELQQRLDELELTINGEDKWFVNISNTKQETSATNEYFANNVI